MKTAIISDIHANAAALEAVLKDIDANSVDTVLKSLHVFAEMVKSLRLNKKKIPLSMSDSILATDVAEYLVKKKVSFRDAHDTVGRIVCYMKENQKSFYEMDLTEFRRFHKLFDEGFLSILDVGASVDARTVYGGTARKNVRREIKKWENKLK